MPHCGAERWLRSTGGGGWAGLGWKGKAQNLITEYLPVPGTASRIAHANFNPHSILGVKTKAQGHRQPPDVYLYPHLPQGRLVRESGQRVDG